MTPGTYLRLRRETAGFAPDFDGVPAQRLAAIEADQADITVKEMVALRREFEFDVLVLARLIQGSEEEEICRICGCSFDDPCDPPCDWAEDGLCDDPDCVEAAKSQEASPRGGAEDKGGTEAGAGHGPSASSASLREPSGKTV